MTVSFSSVSELPKEERWIPSRCWTLKGSFTILGLQDAFSKQNHDTSTFYAPKIASDLYQFRLVIAREGDTSKLGLFLHMPGIADLNGGYSPVHDYEMHAGEQLLNQLVSDKRLWTSNNGWGTSRFLSSATILESATLQKNDSVRIDYIIRQYPPDAMSSLPKGGILPSLAAACRELFDDESTADVCFLIHRVRNTGDSPQRIYAHSKILTNRSEYFATRFKEDVANGGNISALSNPQPGYSSDSDFFDTDEEVMPDQEHHVSGPHPGTGDICQNDNTNNDTNDLQKGTLLTAKVVDSDHRSPNFDRFESLMIEDRPRRVVDVVDVSYRTYRAFIFFLYTGGFALVPPRSLFRVKQQAMLGQNNAALMTRSRFNEENWLLHTQFNDQDPIPWSSAKSMYRLCDRLGEATLMEAATEKIMASLTPENAVVEWTSTFSRQYPAIRKLQCEYIITNWSMVTRTPTFADTIKKSFTTIPIDELTGLLQRLKSANE